MKYSIVKGEPTNDEAIAIEFAMSHHKREELEPVIQKSAFGTPQLRTPLNKNFRYGRVN
ncbi:MAG: hypothetical protein Q7R42_08345 [Candidatus Planktophila sp.]|nr:hypothetical protein [Candidatus Planktophila sp.]